MALRHLLFSSSFGLEKLRPRFGGDFFFLERTVPKKYRFLMFSFTTENALLTHLYKEFREFLSIFRMKRYYNGSLLTHFYKKMP
jgi:hypothetical protein